MAEVSLVNLFYDEMWLDYTDHKSTFDQPLPHQCWPRSMSPHSALLGQFQLTNSKWKLKWNLNSLDGCAWIWGQLNIYISIYIAEKYAYHTQLKQSLTIVFLALDVCLWHMSSIIGSGAQLHHVSGRFERTTWVHMCTGFDLNIEMSF